MKFQSLQLEQYANERAIIHFELRKHLNIHQGIY